MDPSSSGEQQTKETKKSPGEVIDLFSDDSDNDDTGWLYDDITGAKPKSKTKSVSSENVRTNVKKNCSIDGYVVPAYKKIQTRNRNNTKSKPNTKSVTKTTISQGLQAGLVLEEDIFVAVPTDDKWSNRKAPPNVLFEDPEFGPMASSIQGTHKVSITDATNATNPSEKWRPKCRCNLLASLSFNKDGRAYFSCGKHAAINKDVANKKGGKRCNFFAWAFRAELISWYRFGSHNDHTLVRKDDMGAHHGDNLGNIASSSSASTSIFSAQDLVQGKVGDCWFLSALAVVAERPDLVSRLFQRRPGQLQNEREDEQRGIVRVNLFLDGTWRPVTIDSFLPCSLGGGTSRKEDEELQKAIEASLLNQSNNDNHSTSVQNPYAKPAKRLKAKYNTTFPKPASGNDPHGLSETNLRIMKATVNFLENEHRRQRLSGAFRGPEFLPEGRNAATSDLAYSKARRNQLWVPFLEKAYAKIHGSYQAISGGHVAEAFLDLTGAPTLQIGWHAGLAASARSSTMYDDPKKLWEDLMRWRRQKLPMGCGTDRSAGGLIGMHAYSILDVRELTNIGVEFFRDRLKDGTLGNVSGFTEYDGKLRLIRVRNPHGQGEWKGEFSDKCKTWQTLLASSGISLPRTMANDGTFWIGYDDFLLGFSNIDVVLAFKGNHAKSFVSNFPPKKSSHRCQRAFEVSLLDPQPGLETKDRVEIYVMGIQKSKRGARQGRSDRKKSYKVSDLGILVGEYPLQENTVEEDKEKPQFSAIHGQMFGFKRNGHYKLVLDHRKCKRLVVMPISFGHPAATDEHRSFIVRFNADAPLMIRELEAAPRMDRILGGYLMSPKPSSHFANTRQGAETVLWKDSRYKVVEVKCLGNDGGTVFVYLCALQRTKRRRSFIASTVGSSITLGLEATCRGMSCRVAEGLLDHETMAKGKKFQASWRKYKTTFEIDPKSKPQSRLMMVLYQSGQDTEMGTIHCKPMGNILGSNNDNQSMVSNTLDTFWTTKETHDDYKKLGIFHPVIMTENTFQQNGCKNGLGNDRLVEINDKEDEDLEMAIALSRQDAGIVIRNGETVSSEDAMLQEALERSRRDTRMEECPNSSSDESMSEQEKKLRLALSQGSSFVVETGEPVVVKNGNTSSDEDSMLQEALERSRKEAEATRKTRNSDDLEQNDALRQSYLEAIGTESENDNSKTHPKEEKALTSQVFDLVDGEDDNDSIITQPDFTTESAKKRQAIDLTASVVTSIESKKKPKTNAKSDSAVVLDLTPAVVEIKAAITPKKLSIAASGKKDDVVFILSDSSDDENALDSQLC